jgi:GGDEF domain-containing protein
VTRAASFTIPAVLLPIAAVLTLSRTLPDPLTATVNAAPLVIFAGGAVFGFVVRRGRLVLALVALALADQALVYFGDRAIFGAVALLLPLNLAVIAWLGDASPLTTRGGLRLGAILLQAGLVGILRHPGLAPLAASLEQPLLPIDLSVWTALPQVALSAFVTALIVVLGRFRLDHRPLAAGTAWALVASFLALDVASSGGPASVHFGIAGLLLVVGAASEPPRVAHRDDVTRLPTRYELNKTLLRLPRSYALARIEIDDFMRFRQEYGNDSARRMLRLVADALAKVPGGGRAFHCEAHTFAVVFPRTSAELATQHLDVVRRVVETTTLDITVPERSRDPKPKGKPATNRTVLVTVSAGVASSQQPGADPHEIMRAADAALHRVREAGGNRVSV